MKGFRARLLTFLFLRGSPNSLSHTPELVMADAPRALIDDGSTFFGGSIPGLCLRATNTRSAWWASPTRAVASGVCFLAFYNKAVHWFRGYRLCLLTSRIASEREIPQRLEERRRCIHRVDTAREEGI
ncbi:hypothetical protein BHM03_00029510 [Ensete ventricosum]|nr:hypothetical protein BHM03_00029510 [Ensete ventricosum]